MTQNSKCCAALSALLRVTPQERQDPAIWFPLVDAARAAIKFVPINRCDNCDNGVEPEWPFCAWCGVAQELDPKYPLGSPL